MKLGIAWILLAFAAGIVISTRTTQALEAYSGGADWMANDLPDGSVVHVIQQDNPDDGADTVEALTSQIMEKREEIRKLAGKIRISQYTNDLITQKELGSIEELREAQDKTNEIYAQQYNERNEELAKLEAQKKDKTNEIYAQQYQLPPRRTAAQNAGRPAQVAGQQQLQFQFGGQQGQQPSPPLGGGAVPQNGKL
eukprot:GHVT01050761.1.p1 GENE.GHVT01050761.1~~GHVT01050761.1.p1  ORF type:complete len:196 (-),score=19.22 GHVT01050761.1:4-591(-)